MTQRPTSISDLTVEECHRQQLAVLQSIQRSFHRAFKWVIGLVIALSIGNCATFVRSELRDDQLAGHIADVRGGPAGSLAVRVRALEKQLDTIRQWRYDVSNIDYRKILNDHADLADQEAQGAGRDAGAE